MYSTRTFDDFVNSAVEKCYMYVYGLYAGDMDHGALRKEKNCPYINEERHVMECLVLASNAATNSLTIAVIIFFKSLNTLEREEI